MNQYNTNKAYDYLLKFVYVGDCGVGKSQMLRRYSGKEYLENLRHTLGVEFTQKRYNVDGNKIKAQLWDTSGEERFSLVSPYYFRGTIGVLCVFDISNRKTFDHACTTWLARIREHTNPNVHVILVGNKCDLEDSRAVTTEEAAKFAEANTIKYMETSALDKKCRKKKCVEKKNVCYTRFFFR